MLSETKALPAVQPVPSGPGERVRPCHVGIIMDGNGRWAQSRGLPRNEGHRQGVENVRRILKSAREAGLRYLTLYAFSCENWSRPEEEVSALMFLLERYLRTHVQELMEQGVQLRAIGRLQELPEGVHALLRRIMAETAGNSEGVLTLALNYGARTEVLDAVAAWQAAVKAGREDETALDWATFSRFLYTADLPDPDLIIRTSGENRISNFLLLQAAYAEFYFSPKFWPDFTPEDFAEAVDSFGRRERRFGRTGEQIRSRPQVPV